jgi:lipopolysaccharide/colanic/teichoic acid biosynthesis glycosyltransferase
VVDNHTGLFIKLESKGPLFLFKKRNGLNYKELFVISLDLWNLMRSPLESIKKTIVTRVGRFIRKTN